MRTLTRKMIIPDWASWMAQDCFGVWYVYEFVPVLNEDGAWDAPDGDHERLYEGLQTKPWQGTLTRI